MSTVRRFFKKFISIAIMGWAFFVADSFACTSNQIEIGNQCVTGKFVLTTSATNSFQFSISASGTFTVDCGDSGTLSGTGASGSTITKSDTTNVTYTCSWGTSAAHTIVFDGTATGYSTDDNTAAIVFTNASNITNIYGSLGHVFPTLNNGSNDLSKQPRFCGTFEYCGMTSVPSGLFDGVFGTATGMFMTTFMQCSNLTTVPADLFIGASGEQAPQMFVGTFIMNTSLSTFDWGNGMTTSYIPPQFFGSISVEPEAQAFMTYIFHYGVTLLATSCPEGTVQNVTGFEKYWAKKVSCAPEVGTSYSVSLVQNESANDDTVNATVSVKQYLAMPSVDSNDTALTAPVRSGYAFNGYYDARSGGNKYYNSDMSSAHTYDKDTNSTLYAQWLRSNTVTLYQNESDNDDTVNATIAVANTQSMPSVNTSGTTLTAPTRNGYVFNGYYDARSGGTKYYNANMTSAHNWATDTDGALYAQWLRINTVTLYQNESDNDDTVNATVSVTTNSSMPSVNTSGTTLTAPTRNGYVFNGYYDARTGGTKYYNANMTSAHAYDKSVDSALYAQWLGIEFTLTTTSTNSFQFSISASGTFIVNCGDGGSLSGSYASGNTITHTSTSNTTYTCSWETSAAHTIEFGGRATGYSTGSDTAVISFYVGSDYTKKTSNAEKVASITGSLGQIFPTLNDGSNNLSKQPRFTRTFYSCSNLTSVPSGLFDGISGAASNMFYSTFTSCAMLTSLPSGLFGGISGAADHMFYNTFSGCTGLTSIPSGLFNGISGAADYMFGSTFRDCTGLTSIPSGLFNGISGAADYMFHYTFYSCSNLTTVPADLFAGVSGAQQAYMFSSTFSDDTKLNTFDWGNGVTTSYIPPQFFGSISSTPTANNFMSSVFRNTAIATSCPSNISQYVTGFENYWDYPSAATAPGQKVSCAPTPSTTYTVSLYQSEADNDNTINATVNAPADVGMPTTNSSGNTLTPPTRNGYRFIGYYDARVGGTKYYNTNMTPAHNWDKGANGVLYAHWFETKFTLTTTATNSYSFEISASGVFYVDWGDGKVDVIDRTNDTAKKSYSHSYASNVAQTLHFGGSATGYSTASDTPAIRFDGSDAYKGKIASISGSLGAIFPTLNDGSNDLSKQPRFYRTFYSSPSLKTIPSGLFNGIFGAADHMFDLTFSHNGLTSIPSGLFNGISGAATYMFYRTFWDCTSLTSLPSGLFNVYGAAYMMFNGTFWACTGLRSISENLFIGLSGNAHGMFDFTFAGCSNLTSIPSGLFNGISGAADLMFFSTFNGCTSLTSIPSGLFNGVSGAASSMFATTFSGCTNLTTIPANLFAGVSGTPQNYMFRYTFSNATLLSTFDWGNGKTTSYIPPQFFGTISSTPDATDFMTNVFNNTAIATSCPANTEQYITGFESYWNGKVSCEPSATIITINWDDGTNTTQSTCTYGDEITLPATPTRPGYVFAGWKVKSN